MNVIFLSMAPITNINVKEIYPDLLREFTAKGHQVFIVSPRERRLGEVTGVKKGDRVLYLGVRTLNLQKTNVLEKGIGQILVESQFIRAIRHYLSDIKFDLILYATPPITMQGVVKYLRKINPQARTYLLLKDIFPQNAVDVGLMTKTGMKGFLYRYFRKKEKALYNISDYIGCMSPANVKYVLEHNPDISPNKVEIAPNSIQIDLTIEDDADKELQKTDERYYIRNKYGLPTNKPLFIYGGNLGRPQGVNYLMNCLDALKGRTDCFFLVIGNGTEYGKLEEWIHNVSGNHSVMLIPRMDRNDYDLMVRSSDVGLIFLDYRFTIPNYPSRLLNYLENRIPIICATDNNSDIGTIAEANGYGFRCESRNPDDFVALVEKMIKADRKAMGEKGYQFLKENYLVEHTYQAIIKHV